MRRPRALLLAALALLVLAASAPAAEAGGYHTAQLLRQLRAAAVDTTQRCEPTSVPAGEQRCAYVQAHADICFPHGGFQRYLLLHYCTFGDTWAWASLLLLTLAAVVAFAVLLTVSERFFCPALELISDYLKLPPVVAGATLLSFGNGAPDTFTQVAAIAQDGGSAVGMALAEPLGGGLFASNVVLGLVVLIGARHHVTIQRGPFLKDAGFYLVSLLVIAAMLADGKVTTAEAGTMCGLYVVYVLVTFYTSRTLEPLHADVALREMPPDDGGVDAFDESEEDAGAEHAAEGQLLPQYVDATTSVANFDMEAYEAAAAAAHSPTATSSSTSPGSLDSSQQQRRLPAAVLTRRLPGHGPATVVSVSTSTAASGSPVRQAAGSRTLQALLSFRHHHRSSSGGGSSGGGSGLREPLLLPINESPAGTSSGQGAHDGVASAADSSGGELDATRAASAAAAADAPAGSNGARQWRRSSSGRALELPAPLLVAKGAGDGSASSLLLEPWSRQHEYEPAAATRHFSAHDFGAPDRLQRLPHAHANGAPGGGGGGGLSSGGTVTPSPAGDTTPRSPASAGATPRSLLPTPRAASDTMMMPLGRRVFGRCSSCSGHGPMPPPTAATPSAGPAPPPSPGRASVAGSDATPWHQLHEQHMAEQVELLEQQAAEQQALLAAHEDEQALKGHSSSLKHRLQAPFVLLLSCTMPRVGTGSGHRYSRTRACLLPVTMPLLWLAAAPSLLDAIGWPGLAFGGVCGGVGSAILSVTYPASNVPRKELKGLFAVLAFVQAIVWLDLAASALVQVCVVVGVIFDIAPALLGATVLAWGNSVPDLLNNTAMARDGFPSMAVAACFASPLFTLLVGMGGALVYGSLLHNRVLAIPVDTPLLIMAGFAMANMVQHIVLVPTVHRYRMRVSLAVPLFLFYLLFNVMYLLATVGIIRMKAFEPAGGNAS